MFIADRLAPFVDHVFANVGVFSGATLWLTVIAYAFQIYCDFSGYSDMAIGVARIPGYDFSRNFNLPYIATNIRDFWREWHISLSSWLRDYLYIPLGGNRRGRGRAYLNLMLTMVLGGLWHGAAWTFVFWGGLHGVSLAAQKAWPSLRLSARRSSPWGRGVSWTLTMLVVLVSWVFFRSRTFVAARTMLARMFTFAHGVSWFPPFAFVAISLMVVQHVAAVRVGDALCERLTWDRWYTPVILMTMVGLCLLFYPRGFAPFIYFQF